MTEITIVALAVLAFVEAVVALWDGNRQRTARAISERELAAARAHLQLLNEEINVTNEARRAADKRLSEVAAQSFQFAKQNRDLAERLSTIRLQHPEAVGDRPRVEMEKRDPLPLKVEQFLDGVQSEELREELAHKANRMIDDNPGISPENVYAAIAEGSEEVAETW